MLFSVYLRGLLETPKPPLFQVFVERGLICLRYTKPHPLELQKQLTKTSASAFMDTSTSMARHAHVIARRSSSGTDAHRPSSGMGLPAILSSKVCALFSFFFSYTWSGRARRRQAAAQRGGRGRVEEIDARALFITVAASEMSRGSCAEGAVRDAGWSL